MNYITVAVFEWGEHDSFGILLWMKQGV